MEYSDWAFA
jgi:hypothetical protein